VPYLFEPPLDQISIQVAINNGTLFSINIPFDIGGSSAVPKHAQWIVDVFLNTRVAPIVAAPSENNEGNAFLECVVVKCHS